MIYSILFTALFIQSPEIEYGKSSTLGRYIESNNWSERRRAYDYALNGIIGVRRQKMKPYLMHIVKKGASPRYGMITTDMDEPSSQCVALSILAEWHDPSLIPLFLEYIVYPSPDQNRSPEVGLGREPRADLFAAVKGLINIGQPALEPTLRELIKSEIPDEKTKTLDPFKRANIYHRYNNLIHVIGCILGYEGAKNYFAKEIEKLDKTDSKSADKLREALKYLEKNYRNQWNG